MLKERKHFETQYVVKVHRMGVAPAPLALAPTHDPRPSGAQRVPDVKAVSLEMKNLGLISKQEDIVNDHIAFRTLGIPNLGIYSFERIFLHHGYTKQDHYFFPKKKLEAYWYKPPHDSYPRVFISELKVENLSP